MPADRSVGRNVHFYDAKNREVVLGGLVLANGITKSNFYSMLEILLLFESSFSIEHENSATLVKNEEPLPPGNYYVVGSFTVNNETCLTRTLSLCRGTRLKTFTDEVRKRDSRCVITKKIAVNAHRGFWTGFEAAHIFPLAYEAYWIEHNFARWITIPAANGDAINSKQNGLLLRADIHALFDTYEISINPDDNYKIVCFVEDGEDVAGKYLDEQFRNDPDRACDELLRWHFRQAILTNMRGAGEPHFELDLPPGSDNMGEVCRGPKAAERMEFELFSRFALLRNKRKASSPSFCYHEIWVFNIVIYSSIVSSIQILSALSSAQFTKLALFMIRLVWDGREWRGPAGSDRSFTDQDPDDDETTDEEAAEGGWRGFEFATAPEFTAKSDTSEDLEYDSDDDDGSESW